MASPGCNSAGTASESSGALSSFHLWEPGMTTVAPFSFVVGTVAVTYMLATETS